MKHYNFNIALLMFSQAFCTRHVVASRGASSHQKWESTYPGRLVIIRRLPQTHWSTCPWQKQNLPEKKQKTNKYKTLLLSVFSRPSLMSLCEHPKLSDWPRTFRGTTNTDWCAILEPGSKPRFSSEQRELEFPPLRSRLPLQSRDRPRSQ